VWGAQYEDILSLYRVCIAFLSLSRVSPLARALARCRLRPSSLNVCSVYTHSSAYRQRHSLSQTFFNQLENDFGCGRHEQGNWIVEATWVMELHRTCSRALHLLELDQRENDGQRMNKETRQKLLETVMSALGGNTRSCALIAGGLDSVTALRKTGAKVTVHFFDWCHAAYFWY
jgi:hypothetical protein